LLQGTLFPPESTWRSPSLSDLPDWRGIPRVGLDTETRDEKLKQLGCGARRKDAYMVGTSFAFDDNTKFYLPIRHLGGDNMDPEKVLEYLRYQAYHYDGEIVGANLQYDIDMLAEDGIVFRNVKRFRDVQVAEPLIDELQMSYSLQRISQTWGEEGKEEVLFKKACAAYGFKPNEYKKYLWKLPARYVGPYAEEDAAMPLRVIVKQEAELSRYNLNEVYDLESDCLPVLVKMRRRGVAIDSDRLDKVENWAIAEETKALAELHRHTGVRVKQGDTMKVNVVAPALLAVGINLPTTATGKWSITKDVMAQIDHPAADILRRARKMSQLRTTFVNSVRRHSVNGRIHCTFNQLRRQKDDDETATEGAAYGRLSCSNPNLQQQPARDPEIGPMWRSIYVSDQDAIWAQLDYSQQEPRMLLHFAVLARKWIGIQAHDRALVAQARFHADPTMDNHTMFTRLVYGDEAVDAMIAGDEATGGKTFKQARDRCKNIFLGICYGMGGPKLCRSIGLPVDVVKHKRGYMYERAGAEGQAMLDKVDRNVPYVRAMAKALEKRAKEKGYVKTLSGRRCRFPKDDFGNFDWAHKGLNRLIQGSSADQTKRAMVEMDAAGIPLQLQVHDEFDFSAESEAQANLGAEIMRGAYNLGVPSAVDVGLGPSWGEIKE